MSFIYIYLIVLISCLHSYIAVIFLLLYIYQAYIVCWHHHKVSIIMLFESKSPSHTLCKSFRSGYIRLGMFAFECRDHSNKILFKYKLYFSSDTVLWLNIVYWNLKTIFCFMQISNYGGVFASKSFHVRVICWSAPFPF